MKKRDKRKQAKIHKITTKRAVYEKIRKQKNKMHKGEKPVLSKFPLD